MSKIELGRQGGRLTTIAVLTDIKDSGSWVDMTCDPVRAANWFVSLNVGRFVGLALFNYSDRGRNEGDEFTGMDLMVKRDRGYWNVTPPGPVEIVNQALLDQLGIGDIASRLITNEPMSSSSGA